MHVVNIVMFYAYVYKLCIEICVSATYALNVVLTETSVFGIIFFSCYEFLCDGQKLAIYQWSYVANECLWESNGCMPCEHTGTF